MHDRLAGYAPVSTVQSLVLAQQPLYPSSLRPPAALPVTNLYMNWRALLNCTVLEYWRHAMHFVIPVHPGMTFVHSRFPGIKKTGPGM